MEELMPEASVRWDSLLHSLAITAVLRVRLDSGWWSRSPGGWVQAGPVPFKCAFFPLPAGALSPEGSNARAGGDHVGSQLMRRCSCGGLTTGRGLRYNRRAACAPARSGNPTALRSPWFHAGDHSLIASSSPHSVPEPLCRVGGAWVDSTEHRLWQFQACNLFVCLILSNKNVFTFRRNELILLSKPPFSIWSMLDIIVIHEYRESFSMRYNSMYFKLRNYKKKFLDKYSDSTEVKLLRSNHSLSFRCDINGEYAQHLKRRPNTPPLSICTSVWDSIFVVGFH